MRVVTALLFVALVAAGVWSFAVAPARGWWMPAPVSTYGGDVDRLFTWILWIIAFFFAATILCLAWVVWRGGRARGSGRPVHGHARLELAWTIVPAAILIALAFAQVSLWNEMQAERGRVGPPFARVRAAQFEWRFTYPGPDGRFDTADDLERPYELVVPVGERIVLSLASRDVIHGFFVPAFRLKQDVVPGVTITTWFEARETGSYDLLCTQLCGFGHYQMAGKVRVVSREDYATFLAAESAARVTNGRGDARK